MPDFGANGFRSRSILVRSWLLSFRESPIRPFVAALPAISRNRYPFVKSLKIDWRITRSENDGNEEIGHERNAGDHHPL